MHFVRYLFLILPVIVLMASVPSPVASGGSILHRGGPGGGGGAPGAEPSPSGGVVSREETAARTQNILARTTRSMEDVARMQEAARAAAMAGANNLGMNPNKPGEMLPDVPDGLGAGGLQMAPGAGINPELWQGANLPSQQLKDGKTLVTIGQTAAQALLHWETFNIGKATHLHFDQSAGGVNQGNWTAFNFIHDPSGNPTQILGQITAPGQVYIINRNGIMFGGSSQVNLRGLTASALPINTNLIERGLLNNPDAQFLFSALEIPSGANDTPGFVPEPPSPVLGRYGDILVMAGAKISSTVSEEGGGGRVFLAGPNVTNHGSISSPNGQTILAAGLQMGIVAHSGNDPSLRGLDVYVGAIGMPGMAPEDIYAGTVTHSGLIEMPRGNVSMVGRELNVSGMIDSSTSVALNGRVDLLANYGAVSNPLSGASGGSNHVSFLNLESGTVRIEEGSVIRILPELDSDETVAASELALRSHMNIQGRAIYLGEDSTILAPSGIIDLNAGIWNFRRIGNTDTSQFINAEGQIYLDQSAVISAAGSTGIVVPASNNVIAVELRGSELADSPVQRNGILRGQTIYVDVRRTGTLNGVEWVGSPIADVSGYLGLVERTVGELTVDGGTVNLNAGGSIVMQEGSAIDVSGGWIHYEGGPVKTTRLLSGGKVIDIADANPNVVYDGIYNGTTTVVSERWGVADVYSNGISPDGSSVVPDYTHGGHGGNVELIAAAMVLDGGLRGSTIAGERQRENLPDASSLTIAFESRNLSIAPLFPVYSPTPPDIFFKNNPAAQVKAGVFEVDENGVPTALSQERMDLVVFSPEIWSEEGFGDLTIRNREGDIFIPEEVILRGVTGGSLDLAGANVRVEGKIHAAGGNVELKAHNISLDTINWLNTTSAPVNPTPVPGRGIVHIGENAVVSTAGGIVDDRPGAGSSLEMPFSIKGGRVFMSGYDTHLKSGSVIDVSGGVYSDAVGKLRYGDGGDIVIEAGRDRQIDSVLGGSLELEGTLLGYAGGTGGSLDILAPSVQIGGVAEHPETLLLDPGFFNKGGFASFNLRGIGATTGINNVYVPGVRITSGTHIRPEVTSLIAVDGIGGLMLDHILREEGRRSPVHMGFGATGAANQYAGILIVRGEVVQEEGSVIETDALGSVSMNANVVNIGGTIITPGGQIRVQGGSSYDAIGAPADHVLPTVFISEAARLLAQGKTVLLDDGLGLRSGVVHQGGRIDVSGNILAENGALLDVSGSSGVLDLPVFYVPVVRDLLNLPITQEYVPVTVDSRGGSINLAGSRLLVSGATLRGDAGGEQASGGSLSVSSGRFYRDGEISTTADINLWVSQSGPTYSDAYEGGPGKAVYDADGQRISGGGYFAVDDYAEGGFAHLTLGGNVHFTEAVTLEAEGSLRIARGGVVQAEDTVVLNAPYVAIGQDFRSPLDPARQVFLFTQNIPGIGEREYHFQPVHGSGNLMVEAELIDMGTLSMQGIGGAEFLAMGGDIRGNGVVNIAGDLVLDAAQVYPTTAGNFTLTAFDYVENGVNHAGSLTFRQSGTGALPFSAGGTLNAHASVIHQEGVLRAPFGTIQLGWDGSGSAPVNLITGAAAPVASEVILGSGSFTSVSGIGPDGKGQTIPYGIVLNNISWIDPRGIDITLEGPPAKAVHVSGQSVTSEAGSVIDTRGGGDLMGYRWIPGVGGTRDVLADGSSFAVIPGYIADYAPYAPYNSSPLTDYLGGDAGYVNGSLRPGDQVYLSAASGMPAGTYTLLPARYALLPGAFLVTPKSGTPVGADTSITQADGSHLVSGYRYDGFQQTAQNGEVLSLFEVASRDVALERAEYVVFSANEFIREAVLDRDMTVPRLPEDSGQLVFNATKNMDLRGILQAAPIGEGRGSLVDINSVLDILIASQETADHGNVLFLDASTLSNFAAASLLIGGIRDTSGGQITVDVSSDKITVDNAGTPLTGSDIILVANEEIVLKSGSQIHSSNANQPLTENLLIGDAGIEGSGDGILVRVSNRGASSVQRLGVSDSTLPMLRIEEGAELIADYALLDSSYGSSLDSEAILEVDRLGLNSGQISVIIDDTVSGTPSHGLVLSGDALDSMLESVSALSLLSYSSIDLYGNGVIGTENVENLSLTAPVIRGFENDGGEVRLIASNITLDNTTGRSPSAPGPEPLSGELFFDADNIRLGEGDLAIQNFSTVTLSAEDQLVLAENGGLSSEGDVKIITEAVVAEKGASQAIVSEGSLDLVRPGVGNALATRESALGASLTLAGQTVNLNSDIILPSGELHVRAADSLRIGNQEDAGLDVGGRSVRFFDRVEYTGGGTLNLTADQGDIRIGEKGTLVVSAEGIGDAGTLSVKAPQGQFILEGELLGEGENGGSFEMDVGLLAGESLASLDASLGTGGFGLLRDYRVRSGDVHVDGNARSRYYSVSADDGSVLVSGVVEASGRTGGSVALRASDDVVLESGSLITVAGEVFSNAGKGGKVFLEAGSQVDGMVNYDAVVDIRDGSTIDLSVVSKTENSAALGQHSGVLHLRAPQNQAGTDLGVEAIAGTVVGASHIEVEGFELFDLTGTGGELTTAVQNQVRQSGVDFLGAAGTVTPQYQAIFDRLVAENPGLEPLLILQSGAEIVNRDGDLTLGRTNSNASADWNLADYRFGPLGAAGVLTLRASGDLVFYNALSDGFSGGSSLWLAPLMEQNTALPANAQSWSYRLTAGADMSSADYRRFLEVDELAGDKGSLLLGKNMGNAIATGGNNALTSSIIGNNFQVIRTGSGDIDVNAGRNVRLLNPFAAIYTAGTAVTDPTTLYANNDFVIPSLTSSGFFTISQGSLGAIQQVYPARYSMSGGDVRIQAGENIERMTRTTQGLMVRDSSRQLPNNWLYRRGYVDGSGEYGAIDMGAGFATFTDTDASTSWWVDFSNFFQSVGALGGGDVTLMAGRDVSNVDAVIPTNARAPKGVPDPGKLLELGGGDLIVQAGRNIDGGIYYVERGDGVLNAGNKITTNAARSINRGIIQNLNNPTYEPEETWMPTTLFLGKGSFAVNAVNDVLLGEVANPFLLPQGVTNKFWYKTYFSTYGPDSEIRASSLAGDLNWRTNVTMADTNVAQPFLQVWMSRQNLLAGTGTNNASYYQPWLRLNETSVAPFSQMVTVMPSSMRAVTFSGDLNLSGNFNLFPSATGTVDLLSAGVINALTPTGVSTRILQGQRVMAWSPSRINLSDADPRFIPSISNPFSYYPLGGTSTSLNAQTQANFLQNTNRVFNESGATNQVLQTRQTLHDSRILHRNDPYPVYLYAAGGDLSGLTLYSAKPARIIADRDIADVSFYLQNLHEDHVSMVAAGRDIVLYNPNSELRQQATSSGNAFNTGSQQPLAGDIQVSGPGVLEVLAGRHLNLGTGPSNSDGTASGVTTVGNRRNPFLPSEGADIFVAAGIGPAVSWNDSGIDFNAFINDFLNPDTSALSTRYLPELAKMVGVEEGGEAWDLFDNLPDDDRARLSLQIFYLVLRDAGRDFNNPDAETFGEYTHGFEAVEALLPGDEWYGDISLTSRQFKTLAGGDISMLAPGGALYVGFPVANARPDQGILTEGGGNIHIFTDQSVEVGSSRIFTLRGGNEIIWSSQGDIAAGSAAKTVRSAPPTRVIVDSQTASVETDLSGLATGGGIGVLQTVAGAPAGDVDLIAPTGFIDAGDAGIRVSGSMNIAAVQVLNAGNIQVGGTSAGVPVTAVPAPNIGGMTAASAAASTAAGGMEGTMSAHEQRDLLQKENQPSIISVEVIGFGGDVPGEKDDETE